MCYVYGCLHMMGLNFDLVVFKCRMVGVLVLAGSLWHFTCVFALGFMVLL